MMKKKGQGALEYLMTYGWALLIIVVVGAALYALGVLNPATYTQSRCTGFQYFIYQDQKYASTGAFSVVLLNGNTPVEVTALSVGGTSLTMSEQNVSTGAKFTLSGTGATAGTVGDAFSNTVTVTYNTEDISGKTDSATCTGKLQ
jgi:hypothetical protein